MIPWSDIDGLIVFRTPTQAILQIVLRDPARLRAQQNGLQRLLSSLVQASLRRSGVLVAGDGLLPVRMEQVLTQLSERYQHELTRKGVQVRRLQG